MNRQEAESIYEESFFDRYENMVPPAMRRNNLPSRESQKSPESIRDKPSPRSKCLKKTSRFALWVFGIVIVALLCVVLVKQMSISDLSEPLHGTILPESCLKLKQRGVHYSGIQKLQLPDENTPTEVFCDMTTDGGGWSLVASIHEMDINAKCSFNDRWSAYIPENEVFKGKCNWENEMTFGTVRNCLIDDYKSSGYHKMQASDVMIWHVPSGMSLDVAKNESKLRYRTTNNFLRHHGGNLKNLYNQFYPLKPMLDSNMTDNFLKPIIMSFSSINYSIPGWHQYRMNPGQYMISDKSMYSSRGNQVLFNTAYSSQLAIYGRDFRDVRSNTMAVSSEEAPFTLLVAIRNELQQSSYFELQIYSYSQLEHVVSQYENSTIFGNFSIHYRAFQVYDAGNTKITECRLLFYISNKDNWDSKPPTDFNLADQTSGNTYMITRHRISGYPSRILFGYMLLSRRAGQNYSSSDLYNISSYILERVSKYPNLMDAWKDRPTLLVPISFDKGTATTVSESVPPNLRKFIEPGNLQFRAYNFTGYPSALCPGASVSYSSPEYICVGGISGDITSSGTCGDFAGWGGTPSDFSLPEEPSGYAHSSADLSSTLLLFYR